MNLKLLFLALVIALVFSACSSAEKKQMPTFSPSFTPAPTSTSLPTLTPTHISTPTPVRFQLVASPQIKIVPLSEFQFDRSMVVFAANTFREKVFEFSAPAFKPKTVRNISSDVWPYSFEFSPDHKWVIYKVFKAKDQDDIAHYDVWLGSTTQPDTRLLVVNNLVGGLSITWVNNHQLAIWNWNRSGDCPVEIRLIDPFLKTETTLPDLKGSSLECLGLPFFNNDISKSIYYEDGSGWKQMDYMSQTVIDILPNLKTKGMFDPFISFFWGENGVSFAYSDKGQIQFARNLDETETITASMYQSAQLPEGMSITNKLFEWSNFDKGLVAFDLTKDDGVNQKTTFAIADLDRLVLKNYAIARTSFAGYEGEAWNVVSSSDGRFLSWAIMKLPENSQVLGSVILDTQTGEASFLKDYEIIGFGESQP